MMEHIFTEWYKENQIRFHHGQMDEKEIAYSAWKEGQRYIVSGGLTAEQEKAKRENDKECTCGINHVTCDCRENGRCEDCGGIVK